MISDNMLFTLRGFRRERRYVIINTLTLALGIASCVLIALYLRSELTYDRWQTHHERIYRLTTTFAGANGESNSALSQEGLGPLLVQDYPQLGKQVRFMRPPDGTVLKFENIQRPWDNLYLADPSVFEIFTHQIVYGDPKTAFDKPFSIALSETVASFYFGEQNPIGKTLSAAGLGFQVTLVYKDQPENTHLRYDALFPMGLMELMFPGFSKSYVSRLWINSLFTYVMVPAEFDPADFSNLMQGFVTKYMTDRSGAQSDLKFSARMQPLADVHYGDKLEGDLQTGNRAYVYGFAAIAVFILLAACINYANLATARAAKRAKEIGIRKVLGASRSELVSQFLGEAFIFAALALAVGLLLAGAALALTPIGQLLGYQHLLGELARPDVWALLAILALAVTLLSGLYPAFYLSEISPLAALTQVRRSWQTRFNLRQVLVCVQISISVAVVACTFLMMNQMRYVHEKPLGFEKQNRLLVTMYGYETAMKMQTIKAEIRRLPSVTNASTISVVPGVNTPSTRMLVESSQGALEPMELSAMRIDMRFADSMNLQILEGRAFSESLGSDSQQAVLVNETLVRRLGWDEAVGKRVQTMGGQPATLRVVGVVKDFHYSSLHNAVGPLVMFPLVERYDLALPLQKAVMQVTMVIAMTGERLSETLQDIRQVLVRFDPTYSFQPVFLEDRLDQLYATEARLIALSAIFAGVCIAICMIGIAALSAFMTEQRAREIAVRKVLGASDLHILTLLSRPLAVLVVIAAIPASIVAYYAIDRWLDRFEYHTSISLSPFLLSILLIGLVSFVTVIAQAHRPLKSNPVEALRYE